MRVVHVAVRAEGPTRVLCFSDGRGAALPGDEEETIIKATARLEGLQKHLQVGPENPVLPEVNTLPVIAKEWQVSKVP